MTAGRTLLAGVMFAGPIRQIAQGAHPTDGVARSNGGTPNAQSINGPAPGGDGPPVGRRR